jgi:hypothetical protein
MRVFNRIEVEKFFPVGPLFIERRRTETGLDPFHAAIGKLARVSHVVLIFVPRDRARAERPIVDRAPQRVALTVFDLGCGEISHRIL